MRYLVIVDGEHHPPVVERALNEIMAAGHEVVGVLLAGGTEKVGAEGVDHLAGVAVRSGGDLRALLHAAVLELAPDSVLDLSDEPVLDYRRRCELASVALWAQVTYEGADFRFDPPNRPRLCKHPSVAVVATGKRAGKTAVAGFAARTLKEAGRRPVVLAMGRGGPPEPLVLRGDEVALQPEELLELADAGVHAGSDYVEDALLARVPTVGCWRCGGGLAGAVGSSNVVRGIEIANEVADDLLILEGSGTAIPPIYADVTGLVVPASIPDEYLAGYLTAYKVLLADFVVVTMCEQPFGTSSRISAIVSQLRSAWRAAKRGADPQVEIQAVRTVFRPHPVSSVAGASVFVATTAPKGAADLIRRHLEAEHGCRVAGISHSLSNRGNLQVELQASSKGVDVLLCEIKAAGIDMATRWALNRGLQVVYMDNLPCGINGDDLAGTVRWAAGLADYRFQKNRP